MGMVVGLTLVKKFSYRGDANEEYSNQYWFNGSEPTDATAWKALADAVIAEEKKVYPASTVVVRAYGYNSDIENAASVWSFDYAAATATVPGTLSVGAGINAPGDCAVWVRWKTARLNSKGKPIYLRKYFHPGCFAAGASDTTLPAQVTALNAFGVKMADSSLIGSRALRSQHHDEVVEIGTASPYVTTRTLKRRGKRPGS